MVGGTPDLFKEAVLLRINYYRAMAGIPADIVLLDTLNEIAQLTAHIMGEMTILAIPPFPRDL